MHQMVHNMPNGKRNEVKCKLIVFNMYQQEVTIKLGYLNHTG